MPAKTKTRQVKVTAAQEKPLVRDYTALMAQLKKLSPDWSVNNISMESDILANQLDLLNYSRDLWKTNPYLQAYGDEMAVNVHGPQGIRLRMKIQEESDRVVHATEEKEKIRGHWQRRDRVNKHLVKKGERPIFVKPYEEKRDKATIKAGAPDIFANTYIERAWLDWQRKENCTITGRLSYNESRMLRLRSCARDGDHFIRFLRDPSYKYGIKIQHINTEWCDWRLNQKIAQGQPGAGNTIRMGIEYDASGLVPVAYHFRRPSFNQWQGVVPVSYGTNGKDTHERILADDIIHYAKFDNNSDISRPVPWATAIMSNARQFQKYTEAAVVAARVGACSTTFFESELGGEDGVSAATPDPRDVNALMMQMNPGAMIGLPPGIKAKINNPNNPNRAFGEFRNESLREFCAGLPGASFPVIGQNYAEINFSAGRLDRLSTTGAWQMLQEFDIEMAERRIFEEWLKMALITQAVKLPVSKFEKFNKPHFQARRWPGVDPMKEVNAAASAISNKFTSRTAVIESGVCGESGDFEDTIIQLAEEEMMLESLGMSSATTADTMEQSDKPAEELDDEDSTATEPKPKVEEQEED
jgi:lambda family phage portal protein